MINTCAPYSVSHSIFQCKHLHSKAVATHLSMCVVCVCVCVCVREDEVFRHVLRTVLSIDVLKGLKIEKKLPPFNT